MSSAPHKFIDSYRWILLSSCQRYCMIVLVGQLFTVCTEVHTIGDKHMSPKQPLLTRSTKRKMQMWIFLVTFSEYPRQHDVTKQFTSLISSSVCKKTSCQSSLVKSQLKNQKGFKIIDIMHGEHSHSKTNTGELSRQFQ